jgi:multiple sugar transport system substrate-binding protein
MFGRWVRRGGLAVLLAAVVLANVHCGGGGGATSGPVTVQFWQFWEADIMAPILARFEAENPGIKVQMRQLTWQNGREEIVAAVAAGTTPDLCELGSTWFHYFAASGRLADISAAVDSLRGRIGHWEMATHEGRIHGMPWVVGTRAVFWNKNLFRQAGLNPDYPPDTWPEFLDAARRVHALGGGVYGFGRNTGERYVLFKKFMPLAWSAGGDVLSPDGTRCVFDSPEVREALEFYLSLGPVSLSERQDQIDQAFKQGKVGLIQSGGWLFKTLPTDAPDLEYGVALMPRPAEDRGVNRSFGGGEVLVVFEASPRKEAALKLAAFLARGDNALALCREGKSVQPAALGMENDPYYQANPGERAFVEQLKTAVFTPPHPDWQDIESAVETWVEKALHGEVTAAQATAGAQRDIEAILAKRAAAPAGS